MFNGLNKRKITIALICIVLALAVAIVVLSLTDGNDGGEEKNTTESTTAETTGSETTAYVGGEDGDISIDFSEL